MEEEEERTTHINISTSFRSNADPHTRHSSTPKTSEIDAWLDNLQIFSHKGELVINENGKKAVQRVIYKTGGEQEIITGYDKGWTTKTRDTNFISSSIACILGDPSGVCVLDFDEASLYDEIIKSTYSDRCWPTVKTQRGFHVYFEYSGDTKDAMDSLPSAIGKLDLKRSGQIWFPGCRVKQRNGSHFRYEWLLHDSLQQGVGLLCQMPCDLIDQLKARAVNAKEVKRPRSISPISPSITQDATQQSSHNTHDSLNNDQKRAYLITGHQLLEHATWFQIMCGMRNSQCTYDDAVALTKRYLQASGKAHTSRFDKLQAQWDGSMAASNAGIGTIVHHAKICNQAELSRLFREEKQEGKPPKSKKKKKGSDVEQSGGELWEKYTLLATNEPEWSDYPCADMYLEQQGDNLVYQRKMLYVYDADRVRWKEDDEGIAVMNDINIYLTTVAEQMLDMWKELSDRAKDSDDNAFHVAVDNKIKDWKRNLFTSNQHNKSKSVYKAMLSRLALRGDNVEFDEQRDLFAWDNCVFDVRTGQQIEPRKEDYILTTNGHVWREPTEEEMATVTKMFEDIFPNETHRKSYGSVLWTGLTGHRQEKFIIAQGGGRNGKGALDEFHLFLLNDYGAAVHLGLLTKPIKTGPNVELRSLHKKRFGLASEPDDHTSEQLKANNIKSLTGNENHKARACHSNDDDTRIHMTLVMECNDLPYIQGGTGEAMTARVIIVPFLTTFTNDHIKLASNPTKYKPLVEKYKAHDFKKQHAPALFKYLCSQGFSKLIVTEESKQLGFKYLCSKDELTAWFDSYYEREERATVTVKDVFNRLKCTSFYTEMDKREKRLFTYNSLVANIEKSLALNKYLLRPDAYHLAKRVKGYTIKGWKPRQDIMDDIW